MVVKGATSEYLPVTAGVPQGSILGPLFFLVYINDINADLASITKLFADDTSSYLSLENDVTRAQVLNSDLQKISSWATKWKVKFSAPKTDLLNIHNHNRAITTQLEFNGTRLTSSETHKHLGVTLQIDCKWNTHINDMIAKCRPLISCLKSYKYRLSRKSLETMFKSFILPLLDYADVIWDNCTQYQTLALEEIQLDAIRTIIGSVRGTSHELLYRESVFVRLQERRKRHKLILYFKYVNNLLPDHLNEKFPRLVSETNPYHRRRPLERNRIHGNTELYKNSYFPSTTVLWNSIPDEIKVLTSISAFKRYLTRTDITIPSYYYIGDRIPQIIHCKLRLSMSDLKFDLFNRHLSDEINCICNNQQEDARHYLLDCVLYKVERDLTINLLPSIAKNITTLLYGNQEFSLPFNTYIVLTVHDFIVSSRRFDVD